MSLACPSGKVTAFVWDKGFILAPMMPRLRSARHEVKYMCMSTA